MATEVQTLAANMKLVALLLLTLSPLVGQSWFTQTANPPFSKIFGAVAVARDFNGDGILDLAFVELISGVQTTTVLLGDGTGAFTVAPGSPVAGQNLSPETMVAGDFNGDGKLDLLIEDQLPGTGIGYFTLLLGDGKGGFAPSPLNPLQMEGIPGSMVEGDFNNDGLMDVAISSEDGLTVYLGNASGGLSKQNTLPAATTVGCALAAGDFIGNHQVNIATFCSAGVTVYVNNGRAQFSPLMTAAGPKSVTSYFGTAFLVADFNSDGLADILDGNYVLISDGKGGFAQKGPLPALAFPQANPYSVADFDGDGILDIAAANGGSTGNVIIFSGLGDGTFTQQAATVLTAMNVTEGIVGDFNNDGKPDYLSIDGRVWLNSLTKITVNPKTLTLLSGEAPVPISVLPAAGLVARANQTWLSYANGAVSANTAGLGPGVYSGTILFSGAGLFDAVMKVTLTVGAAAGTLRTTAGSPLAAFGDFYAGDFNGDGKPDLLVSNGATAQVWLGDGAGGFAPAPATVTLPGLSSIALADFNLDGHLDIFAAGNTNQVLFGDGKGAFTNGPTVTFVSTGFPVGFPSVQTADFNLDGFPDLLIAGVVFLNDGKGNFKEVLPSSQPGQTASAVVGDFNGDGVPDVAYTALASSFVYVWLGNGNGGLTLRQRFDFGISDPALGTIAAGDFTGDGILDLSIASAQYPGRIELLMGSGNGAFTRSTIQPYVDLGNRAPINSIQVADFNGDGILDLAAVNSQGSTAILLGNGMGGFTPSPGGSFAVGSTAAVADFNLDGRPDIAGAGTGGLTVLLGSLAQPTVTLRQVPPSPFDLGQTVSLVAKLTPDPTAFQTGLSGQFTLADNGTVVSTVTAGTHYFTTPYAVGTHNFTAMYAGDLRDAPAAATLAIVENGAPAAIQALGNGFPLQAMVTDAEGNPVPGVRVSFSAPSSGAGGIFLGGATAAVLTDTRGIATAPLFIPDGISGSYTITATTTIGGFVCSFAESN